MVALMHNAMRSKPLSPEQRYQYNTAKVCLLLHKSYAEVEEMPLEHISLILQTERAETKIENWRNNR